MIAKARTRKGALSFYLWKRNITVGLMPIFAADAEIQNFAMNVCGVMDSNVASIKREFCATSHFYGGL